MTYRAVTVVTPSVLHAVQRSTATHRMSVSEHMRDLELNADVVAQVTQGCHMHEPDIAWVS
jgi:hypothetical protein